MDTLHFADGSIMTRHAIFINLRTAAQGATAGIALNRALLK